MQAQEDVELPCAPAELQQKAIPYLTQPALG
jgi:hypothetical protein